MWQGSPTELGLPSKLGRWYQCTAEHLIARQDGGKNTPVNVVAACRLCNLRRHQRPTPAPSPETYKALVQRRMAAGRWHLKLPSSTSTTKWTADLGQPSSYDQIAG
ncbi:HNH endonuclease signature motif containing protein [Pseudoxanthomonas sp.]|uniref:HNH endonuclease n=1 Tax=Pseudoxanthomonas sp. TaxID=1871049 RepID=UPI0025EC3363|nr:HNH endonuclease signature motif containing protein [Pseudoxanthomonas sp.]